MVAGWVRAAGKMIEIKGEECQLAQVKRIEEVEPQRRVRHVCVIRDQNVVEMKRVIKRRSEKQHAGENQDSRDFQRVRIVAQCHICSVL